MRWLVCDPNGEWIAWSRKIVAAPPRGCKSIRADDIVSIHYGREAAKRAAIHGISANIVPSRTVLLILRSKRRCIAFAFPADERAIDTFLALQRYLAPKLCPESLLSAAQVDYERAMCLRASDEHARPLHERSSSSSSLNSVSSSSHILENAVTSFKSLSDSAQSRKDYIANLKRDALALHSNAGHLPPRTLVLPLESGSAARRLIADEEQTRKDLVREKGIYFNAHRYDLGGDVKLERFLVSFRARVRHIFKTDDEEAGDIAEEILLAASRTVIEGDIYSLCHRLFSSEKVCLCPMSAETDASPTSASLGVCPINIFIAPDGLITIESHSAYRIVWIDPSNGPQKVGIVRARCIEHMYLGSNKLDGHADGDENVRHACIEYGIN